MRVVVDASVLVYLIYPNAPAPKSAAGTGPVEHCRERIEGLLEDLDAEGIEVLVPTPVLSELLIRSPGKEQEVVAILSGNRTVVIADFDQRAAIENAMLRRTAEKRRPFKQAKKEVSFDLQILAIAKSRGASILLTDDGPLRGRAQMAGIQAKGIEDLGVPDSKRQMLLVDDPSND